MRAIVANLDCELAWAKAHSPGPHKALPKRVRQAVSELSRSARSLGEDGDKLVTLDDVATHSTTAFLSCAPVLAWGQTRQLHGIAAELDEDAPWKERLWQLVCEPDVAAQCNDRRFCLGLALPPQLELVGMQSVASLAELDHFLVHAELGPDDAWVAKAPWSASGRERLKRRGRAVEGEQRAFVDRLLRRYGALLVEPWMERIADFGVAGLVGEALDACIVFPAHQLQCDAGGVFRGIRIDDEQTRAKLDSHGGGLMECARIVVKALHEHGYRGPFGIDSFLYASGGDVRLRAVCEINARITFGHVARATAEAANTLTCDFVPEC